MSQTFSIFSLRSMVIALTLTACGASHDDAKSESDSPRAHQDAQTELAKPSRDQAGTDRKKRDMGAPPSPPEGRGGAEDPSPVVGDTDGTVSQSQVFDEADDYEQAEAEEAAASSPLFSGHNAPTVGTVGSAGRDVSGIAAGDVMRAPMPAPEPEIRADLTTSEEYTDHGVNPFTMVTEDALSTFSIDVDTASYALSRRKLENGSLPAFQAVRVEEFVNYLDYDYAGPTEGPFAVHMEAMPDPFRDGRHILRVGVQAYDVPEDERQPVHLTFLVDVSGSMSSPDKLGMAKDAMKMMLDQLDKDDTVALATYAGRTARVLEPISAAEKSRIMRAIDGLNSSGSTAMSAGIDIAYDMASESFVKGHENRVIILSDGDANVGNTSWDQMLSQIKGHADKGVTLSTIGLGMGNYKDTLMEQLANKGDGNNFYIDSREQAERVFVDQVGGTMLTVARDTKIQVEFNDDSVEAYRLIGYENRDIADVDFRNDRVDAGEVGSGHNVTALYEVILKDGYSRDLATVRLRWEKPGADGEATERDYRFSSRDLKETPLLASSSTRLAYSAATFAEVLRQSPHAAEISLSELASFAKRASRAGEKDDNELVDLIRRADKLGAGVGAATVSR
jgi:Ca-activated chloride channel family protein